MKKILRTRPRWPKDTVLWQVPVRFYDDPIPPPERCTVVSDDSTHDYEGVFSTLAFHDSYGHDVYLDPDNLYPTIEECHAEIQRRREAHAAERKADIAEVMAEANGQNLKGKDRLRAMFSAVQRSWAKGDQRDPGRFVDKTRFSKKDAPS
jgi:hypothetical protein